MIPRSIAAPAAALGMVAALLAPDVTEAADVDWTAIQQTSVVEILTIDPDGDLRETKIWIVVVDGSAWVRTNRSRWLANIRRDPEVRLRVGERIFELRASEVSDAAARESAEAAFKQKYGWVQSVMSFFRLREPTVLRLEPR